MGTVLVETALIIHIARDKGNNLDEIYDKQIFLDFYYEDLKFIE